MRCATSRRVRIDRAHLEISACACRLHGDYGGERYGHTVHSMRHSTDGRDGGRNGAGKQHSPSGGMRPRSS